MGDARIWGADLRSPSSDRFDVWRIYISAALPPFQDDSTPMPIEPASIIAGHSKGTAASGTSLPFFARAANSVSHMAGRPGTFLLSCLVIAVWAVSGPIFGFSDTWQLVINTGTTVVTFLMVFLIQNTQNREGAALQAKLDELIRATREAHNELVAVENKPEEIVAEMRHEVEEEARRESIAAGHASTAPRTPRQM
jgi:low affinity Fe/Cu permease